MLTLGLALLTGCGVQVERAPSQQELAAQGAAFGGVALPEGAEVLAARHDARGPDEAYRVVLQTDPAGAHVLVDASGLTAEPQQLSQNLSDTPLAGPPLVAGPDVVSWKNSVTVDGQRRIRDVTVDSRARPTVYVHLLLYET